MSAVAYIRRSARDESEVSEDTQRDTVADLAAKHGEAIHRVYRDWGRSGGSETRPQYLAMLAEAEAGNIDTIYAYDQDRLARSNFLFASLLRLSDIHGFSVITPAGDLTDPDKRDMAEIRGVMDGAELRKMQKRAKAIKRKQRKRGDDIGVVAFGYRKARVKAGERNRNGRVTEEDAFIDVKDDDGAIKRVIDAYKKAGTYIGAAKILNGAGEPIPFARQKRKDGKPYGGGRYEGALWRATGVRRVVMREAPELVPDIKGTSHKHIPRLFAKLLRCYCGQTLTPGGNSHSPGYWCSRARHDPKHPRPTFISERKLLPWIMEEADRLVDRDAYYVEGDQYDDSEQRQAIETLRSAGHDVTSLEAKLEADRAEHGERERIRLDVPDRIDWDRWAPADVNRALRSLWDHVELGEDMLPVRAVWRVEEWRRNT